MEPQRKKRAVNWTSEEKEILRLLIAQSAHIIEDKSTKAAINNQKVKVWKEITTKFYEYTAKERSTVELKLAWKRMKMNAKSNIALYKRETAKTGGGGKPPSPSAEDLAVMEITPQDFEMEVNNFDSDAPMFSEPQPGSSQDHTLNTESQPQPGSSQDHTLNTESQLISSQDHIYCVEQMPGTSQGNTYSAEPQLGHNCENNAMDGQAISAIDINKHKSTMSKRKSKIQKSNSELRQTIVESNTTFKKRQLEMMEVEHQLNIKIAQLKIKKLELEISLMENQKN